jgi:hypothetical protein
MKINSMAVVYKFALAFILMVITDELLEQEMSNWIWMYLTDILAHSI